jgi:hypothetical protein
MARGLLVRALVPLLFASRVAAQTAPPSCRGSPKPTPMISRARQSTPDRRRRVASGDATTPLMRAIYGGKNGDWWRRTGVDIYGWLNAGFNISTSHSSNAPAAYYIRPNGGELDQVTLYIERLPNTVQTDHVDWGFRITNLYGLDYRYTTAKGMTPLWSMPTSTFPSWCKG